MAGPVAGRLRPAFEGLRQAVVFEPFVDADIEAAFAARIDFAPAVAAAAAGTVQHIFGAAGLGTEVGQIG